MKNISVILSIPAILILYASSLSGITLKETVEHTILTNEEIKSSIKNNEAYKLYVDEAKGDYYPKLDLESFIEKKRTKSNPVVGADTSETAEGFNVQLNFEQLLYDGNETSSNIKISKYTYLSNKYLNISIVDAVLLNSVRAYLNVNKYKDKIFVLKDGLSIFDSYLTTAVDTAAISGESLHQSQVNAKIYYAKNKLYENMSNKFTSISSFKRHVGIEPSGEICRPFQDKSNFPKNLEDYLKKVLSSNALILSQIEKINRKVATVRKSKSKNFPIIKFKASALYDDDLIEIDEETKIYSARIEMVYNLFNGNKDKTVTSREKIFLQEEQKILDSITKKVVDEAMVAYHTYFYSEKRINELQHYIVSNGEILLSYKDLFEGGTKTYIDVLNIERDLIGAKNELVDVEFINDFSYYEVFNQYSYLKQAIVQSDIDCKKIVPKALNKLIVDTLTLDESDENLLQKRVYILFLNSYLKKSDAKKHLTKVKEDSKEDMKIKIIKVSGLYMLAIYDVDYEEDIIRYRDKYIKKYPSSYYGQYIGSKK